MFSASLYYPIYIHIVLFMALCSWLWLYNSDSARIIEEKRSEWSGWLLAILFTIIVGLRPISGYYFGDTANYALGYYAMQAGGNTMLVDGGSDWLFYLLMTACSQIMDIHGFFLIVEALYIIPIVIACKRWFPNNLTLALLFCFTAFSFFSYGTNGIRNGMACSFVILALSYINGDNRNKVIACILSFAAISIHKSAALPALMMFVSLFYRNTKMIMGAWLFSIFISLSVGGFVESLFAALGFDDRLSGYIMSQEENAHQFSQTGFRFDFLLYSIMPIALGYYTVIKRKLFDDNYLMLLHTYILSNAFWVMLIRASFSNRFAYLSWFLYPIVLAYPLLKLHVWEESQGRKCAYILLGHAAFTYLMWLR